LYHQVSQLFQNKVKQAWAELCQAQFKLGLADVDFAFVFPVLKI
jgi:hypothetical protein